MAGSYYLSLRHLPAAVMLLAVSACSPRIYGPVQDSVRVEYRDRIVEVHDTAVLTVEREVERVATRDTVSHLENSWATSDASVCDGFLRHSLESKPQIIHIPVETYVEVHDTLRLEQQVVVREVEKPLTQWQSFLLVLGKVTLAALGLCAAALVIKLVIK